MFTEHLQRIDIKNSELYIPKENSWVCKNATMTAKVPGPFEKKGFIDEVFTKSSEFRRYFDKSLGRAIFKILMSMRV